MRAGSRTLKQLQRHRQQRPRLACFAGEPADGSLVEDAAHLAELSPGALGRLWEVLEPCLLMPMSPALEQALGRFCATHEIRQEALGHVIRALSVMLRGAARVALSRAGFAEDLQKVWPEQSEAHDVVLQRYDDVLGKLQEEELIRALSDHGSVLREIDWRVDRVMGDKGAPRLALPVAIVTLVHERRGQTDALTLQLTPRELRRAAAVFSALAEQTSQLQPPTAQERAAAKEPTDESS